ncbi:MAG TPA: channel protein TolC, partial [Burkholderiales bacterium]|nr:channel protein TolC [Burkholderiales bacterium]
MKRISILVAALLAAGPAFSADLLAVYREASLQDAVYAAAKAQYIAAQERLPQGRALLLPNVNFGAGANYNS